MADIELTAQERKVLLEGMGTTVSCGCEICMDAIAAAEQIIAARVKDAKIEILHEVALYPAANWVNTDDGYASGREWLRGCANQIEAYS